MKSRPPYMENPDLYSIATEVLSSANSRPERGRILRERNFAIVRSGCKKSACVLHSGLNRCPIRTPSSAIAIRAAEPSHPLLLLRLVLHALAHQLHALVDVGAVRLVFHPALLVDLRRG